MVSQLNLIVEIMAILAIGHLMIILGELITI
jgi:hypothetical protein